MRPIVIALTLAAVAAIAITAPGASTADPPQPPTNALPHMGDRFLPKPAGTKENLKFFFGPYTVPPGHDSNRIDLELPAMTGFIEAIEPGMRRVADLTEPSHQEAHIHHAHWFALDPGNEEDNYTHFGTGRGNTEWVFGNGDEETRADFQERSAADPKGPVYGQYVTASAPQLMIYMLHNKTNQPLVTYIVLDVTFQHGTREELERMKGRPYHDVSGVLFGRTYDVPREPKGDGLYETTVDQPRDPVRPRQPIRWTSTIEGTMIGTGGHLHPGGLSVYVENLGSKENPCPDDGRGYGGTLLLKSDAIFRSGVLFSEDFQMEVTHPAWRAPIHKGDRIQITGVYENKDHGWYDVMTHEGIYVDEAQPPKGRCKPYLVNQSTAAKSGKRGKRKKARARGRRAARKPGVWLKRGGARRHAWSKARLPLLDPTEGVANRPWHLGHPDLFCGEEYGGPPCERPYVDRGQGMATDTVTISNFLYMPGDYSLSGQQGAPPRVKKGTPLTFVNADQEAGIRHSVTTCPWPCTGRYVANYPLPDGLWDSSTLGYDPVDGGNPNPVASTPSDLAVGKYSYFCRIHPWMRGAFEVVP